MVDVHRIDKRQFETEYESPEFLVVLWSRGENPEAAWVSSEYRLTNASVVQALAWATLQVDDQGRYVLYGIVPASLDRGSPALIWLAGQPPAY